ncbi:hypothetical protein GCS57_003476 [Vibrio cholerae]|uniref:hypothetical protein n=1 Tax=Vibrio cholerae TaxID=666 RepID=UPI00096B7B20|nr:hypothetical protein [Vibrio cholerae]MBO1386859.1 hypothetical protein [Vibrio cholerae]WOQ91358.1 hypothetical protein R4535_16430 [Vibrio cholerae]
MSQYPEQTTLEELVNIISENIGNSAVENSFAEKLQRELGLVEENYELSADEKQYIMYSFIGNEDHSNKKTLLNASKAQKIVNKKKK